MDNYMIINGQRVELAEEQADKLLRVAEAMGAVTTATVQEPEPKSPFARVDFGDEYYYIGADGNIEASKEDNVGWDYSCYAVANYCTDKDLLQQRAWHEVLNRILWRCSEEHGGDGPWDGATKHYCIMQNPPGVLKIAYRTNQKTSDVYFAKHDVAEAAIRDIVEPFIEAHPDFKW